jgi:hypothetical protein
LDRSQTIVKASGSIIPSLLISDNNIGLVTIDQNQIIQRFLVRKEMKKETKVHRTVVEMNHGRNELDELISAKMREFAHERFLSHHKEARAS